mmetsp:Transcript_8862/g.10946  ORF Transcript_8862/g.10946 Transcript_8862/m.10946 type:complete len:82 (+) Transcript_8862:332-577(+)
MQPRNNWKKDRKVYSTVHNMRDTLLDTFAPTADNSYSWLFRVSSHGVDHFRLLCMLFCMYNASWSGHIAHGRKIERRSRYS